MKTYTFKQAVKVLNQIIPGVGDAMKENAENCTDGAIVSGQMISWHIACSFDWYRSPEKMKWSDIHYLICDLEQHKII